MSGVGSRRGNICNCPGGRSRGLVNPPQYVGHLPALLCADKTLLEPSRVVTFYDAIRPSSTRCCILFAVVHAMFASTNSSLSRLVVLPAFVAQLVVMITSLAVSLPRVMSAPGCITTFFPKEIVIYTIASVVYESFLFGLTVYKYLSAKKEGWAGSSLLMVLVRDGLWAFALVLSMYMPLSMHVQGKLTSRKVAMIANTLFFTIAPATLAALGFP